MEETIRVLVTNFPQALVKRDGRGRDPLLFAVAITRTNPKQAPKVVALLLDLESVYAPRKNLVETTEDTTIPFQYLATVASKIKLQEETKHICNSIKECLRLLLGSGPEHSPRMLSTLRTLPRWLLPTAVLSPNVQQILDEKIKERFPTVLLVSDLYMQIVIIYFFQQGIISMDDNPRIYAVPLFVGGCYFQLRELIQIFTLIWFGSFRTFLSGWLLHISDLLDQVYIVAVIVCGCFFFKEGPSPMDQTQLIIMTISAGLFWAKLFLWLRRINVDFSVFVSGVFYVTGSVMPYMQIIAIFLIAFTQMFQTVFRHNDSYDCAGVEKTVGPQCDGTYDLLPFCDYWITFLHVLNMFLGNVDETEFADSTVGTWLYVIFVFVMVILLASVLIAIITTSYKFIQDSEATMVFYTNRLHFLAETDSIRNFPCFRVFSCGDDGFDDWARSTWDNLFSVFAFGSEDSILYGTHWSLRIIPVLIAIVTIPAWLVLGLFWTSGALWPPQAREWIFTSRIWKSESQEREEKNQHERRENEKLVAIAVSAAREELRQKLSENRVQYYEMKASVIQRKQEIRGEMKRIRVLMSNLFEQAEHLRSQRGANQSDSDSESY